MNEHLSRQQVMDCLVVGPTAEQRTHVENCRECEVELAQFAEPIAAFREAATALSERKALRLSRVDWHGRRGAQSFPPVLVWAAVLLLILTVSVPIVWQQGRQEQVKEQTRQLQRLQSQSPSAASVASSSGEMYAGKTALPVENAKLRAEDALLLEQVDDDVSQSVPQAMAPLTVLVSWSGSGSENEAIQDSSSKTAVEKTAVQKD
jgi:hypothetical protein